MFLSLELLIFEFVSDFHLWLLRSLGMKRWIKVIAPVVFFCCLAGCAASSATKTEQADAIRQLGEAYMTEQNYTMALSELLRAEKMNPGDHLLHQDLGIVYMAKNELEQAVPAF